MQNMTKCPYCGKALLSRHITLKGKSVCAGYVDCQCGKAQAAQEQEKRTQKVKRFASNVSKCGIPKRYLHAKSDQAQSVVDALQKGRNVYIYGDVGTGKTHLASASVRILVWQEMRVKFSSGYKFLDDIKQGFGKGSDPFPEYLSAQVLFLDDFGKESPTDFALERLFALIDSRSNRLKPTAITTQYRPSKLINRLSKNGDSDTAIAIVSRLRENCEIIHLTGKDRRIKNNV